MPEGQSAKEQECQDSNPRGVDAKLTLWPWPLIRFAMARALPALLCLLAAFTLSLSLSLSSELRLLSCCLLCWEKGSVSSTAFFLSFPPSPTCSPFTEAYTHRPLDSSCITGPTGKDGPALLLPAAPLSSPQCPTSIPGLFCRSPSLPPSFKPCCPAPPPNGIPWR